MRKTLTAAWAVVMATSALMADTDSIQLAEHWQNAYQGNDATGKHVIALWSFDQSTEKQDPAGKGFDMKLMGAKLSAGGRFGGALESFRGWPDEDVNHGAKVKDHPALSPKGAFTLELWIKPKPELKDYPSAFLIDKKYVSHTDYQMILGPAGKHGNTRTLRVVLGYGADSATYTSDSAVYSAETWYHIAFTYDAAGNGRFYRDGSALGGTNHAGREAVAPGKRFLTIGDRNGSLYHGFPGFIDQVRISNGALEFRPAKFGLKSDRTTFIRMEEVSLEFTVTNMLRTKLEGGVCRFAAAETVETRIELPELEPGAVHTVPFRLDTSLRPGQYNIHARMELPGDTPYVSEERFPVTIVPRPLPHSMPVVMWGVGGIDNVLDEMDTLKDIGFTHCLGCSANMGTIWDAGAPTTANTDEHVASAKKMLDSALARGFRVMIGLTPGRWAKSKKEFRRVDRNGEAHEDVNGLFPEIQQFCYNAGASVAQTYGRFPALDGAMVHTEVRGASQTSFSEMDRRAFRDFAGYNIPDEVGIKNGLRYGELKQFPTDRIVRDDNPVLTYYRWFWKVGDGWNALHTAVHRGLKSGGNKRFWTFHDPAVRVASAWGNGGEVDVLSQWTYSYPDPIRIGMATDELFAMADGAGQAQRVMKMTQIIWYRRQTAPMPGTQAQVTDAFFDDHDHGPTGDAQAEDKGAYRARWEKEIPDAPFITIAPMHLREAFWTKIARPVQGIMYHGWQSLVPDRKTRGYRYTHSGTKDELRRLVKTVIEPLGPALMQVADREADVAFLESFTAQMFARRGTYGWNGGWAGDAYLILHYAQLQPRIVYDETVARDGLDRFKVLVMVDCDVLTESVAKAAQKFQDRGGIIIGDENLAPRIRPDILLQSYSRPKQADEAQRAMLDKAAALRTELDAHYSRYNDSSNPDVITRCRRYNTTDYLFAVNDLREYGNYVGHHGLVMENGLPSDAAITVRRESGVVYDLVNHCQVSSETEAGAIRLPVRLGPCEGRVFMITDRRIDRVQITAPERAKRGEQIRIGIAVLDKADKPINAIVPLKVDLLDPAGEPAEFSGYYGAKDGRAEILLDMAPNDTPGIWTIDVRELASDRETRHYMRLDKE